MRCLGDSLRDGAQRLSVVGAVVEAVGGSVRGLVGDVVVGGSVGDVVGSEVVGDINSDRVVPRWSATPTVTWWGCCFCS